MQEKYGFIYIWRDRKHKRYYIGSHWGFEDDSYICSSRWMRKAYKRRKDDFRRKILISNINDRKQTLKEEYKWLSLIKDNELGKKYYNLRNCEFNHWSIDNLLTVGEKISASPLRNERISKSNKGKTHSEEAKQLIREANKRQFEDFEQRELRRKKIFRTLEKS